MPIRSTYTGLRQITIRVIQYRLSALSSGHEAEKLWEFEDKNIYMGLMQTQSRQGWEFAHRFFEWFAHFLWAKEWKNDSLVKKSESLLPLFCHKRHGQIAHGRSLVKNNASKSDKSLWANEWRERFALGQKKGKYCQKHTKNTNFLSDSLVFLSNSLDSRANHSHGSFLKSEFLSVALLNERLWAKEWRTNERQSEFPTLRVGWVNKIMAL